MAGDTVFNLKYEDTVSTLSKAAETGNLKLMKILLKKGKLPQSPDNRGWCAMHAAAAEGQLEALRLLLTFRKGNRKYLSNICTWKDETPLIIALKKKGMSLGIVKLLLESGADPNKHTNKGKTALHYVCKKGGNVNIIKLLLKHGAAVDPKEYINGYTPFHYSVEGSNDENFQFLVNHADVNLTDSTGETPLYKACVCGSMKAVELILSRDKSSVNVMPRTGFSPLSVAALHGNLDMVKLLIGSGADAGLLSCAHVLPPFSKMKSFLPIHSSVFSNVDVFRYFLEVTDPVMLLEYERDITFGSLPIFTVLFASNVDFIEVLLKHTFPVGYEELKFASHDKLAQVVMSTNFDMGKLVQKLQLFFKYYTHFQANTVLEHFKELLKCETTAGTDKYDFILLCAKIGLPSGSDLLKCELIGWLNERLEKEVEKDCILEGIEMLKRGVPRLMQLSRVEGRRFVRSKVSDDWSAFCWIRDSGLPSWMKRYLWFLEARCSLCIDNVR
ncbi:UNVERIFIED_CONTAM: hypothetical protein PYX00_009756 [Menopon gallinae]|uniref:Uncharacterized protein n=1 Tax=Menopon gallinae TaxID=328185 RepID=A0AAW2HCR4_9NEOP